VLAVSVRKHLPVVAAVFFLAVCVSAGSGFAAPGLFGPGRQTSSPGGAGPQLPPGLSPPAPVALRYPKLDHGLNWVLESATPFATAIDLGYRVQDGRIQVYVVCESGALEGVLEWLQENDAAFLSSAYETVQAHVTPALLPLLDTLPGVVAVRRPTYLVAGPPSDSSTDPEKTHTGTYLSEGLAAMNGPAWHAAGFTGQGVKVGVIDVEFGDAAPLLGTELPVFFGLWQCPSCQIEPGKHHGTACAEILMDIVPGASLFVAQVKTTVDVVDAAQWLRSQGVYVISESLASWAGPGDGTGDQQSEVASFTDAGGIWAVSAGNFRDKHWQGHWVDEDGNGFLDMDSAIDCTYLSGDGLNPAFLAAGSTIEAELIWNQWSSPQTNLDFVLAYQADLGDTPAEAARSSNLQSGLPGQTPWERISFEAELAGYYCLAVVRVAGASDVDVEIFTPSVALVPSFPEGSLSAPADSPSALAVAALDAVAPYTLETYSSAGPTNGPGGAIDGGQAKPDIAGYANVSTASYGPRSPGEYSFNGTSAACPHVAGAAALVWSAYPEWSNQEVRGFLEERAVDIDPAGMDNDTGWGQLHLGDPPASSCTYSLSPTSASYGADGGSGSVIVTASASTCAWTASSSALWISITSGSSGTGSGTVEYSVSANTACEARASTMTIAGNAFSVTQEGATCAVDFSFTPANPQIGQTVTFTVTGSATPVSWNFGDVDCDGNSPTVSCTANPSQCLSVEWVYASAGTKSVIFTAEEGSATKTVTVGSSGTCPEDCEADGPPTASFTMAPNPAMVGEVVTFTDTSHKKTLAADFTWIPASPKIGQSVTFHITGVGSVTSAVWNFGAGGCGDFTQNTTCTPTPPFVDCMYQPYEYAEAGTFNISLRASGGAAISKQIVVQNEGTCGGGSCTYSISPTSQSFPATGGTGSVSVYTAAGCTWTATSNSTWIHITSGASGNGPGTVNYSVDANTGAQRSGSMTIAGRTFQVTQNAGGGGGGTAPTEWHWTIKRGSAVVFTSEQQSFTRTFDTPGQYQVTLEAANCAGSDTDVQSLVVEGTVTPEAYVVPAAAHTQGQNQTMWKSDLSIFNPGTLSVVANIEFLVEASDNTSGINPGRIVTILPKGTDIREDVLGWMGVTGDEKGSLSIEFEGGDGTTPVIMSRTYNDTPDGTYGQYVPAVPVLPTSGDSLYLTGLVHNASYRTNVGVANFGETAAVDISVRLFEESGDQLGSYLAAVPPRSSVLVTSIAQKAGVTEPLDIFSAQVYIGENDVTAYASVVDNLTGDPVLYPPYGVQDSHVFVPGVAHLPGEHESLWRSDVTFFNPTEELTTVYLEYVPEVDTGVVAYLRIGLDALQTVHMPDLLGDPVLVGEVTDTKGYLLIRQEDGNPTPQVAARTYNQTDAGTFGQGLKVYSDADTIVTGDTGCIPGVINSADYRTNLGLLNLSQDTPAAVELKVYDESGTLMGSHPGYPLNAEQFLQFDLFQAVGLGDVSLYASVELNVVSGGPVAGYASVVDNRTQDPILIPAQVPVW